MPLAENVEVLPSARLYTAVYPGYDQLLAQTTVANTSPPILMHVVSTNINFQTYCDADYYHNNAWFSPYTSGTITYNGSNVVTETAAYRWMFHQQVTYGTASTSFIYPSDTEEQIALREQLRRKRIIATTRAEELLLLMIGDHRKKQYIENKYFDVQVRGKTYRIHKGRSGNVALIGNDGKAEARYCAHPYDDVPDPDTMLAQFLMLTTDEEKFLKVANRLAVAA